RHRSACLRRQGAFFGAHTEEGEGAKKRLWARAHRRGLTSIAGEGVVSSTVDAELLRFIQGEIDPRAFPHGEHVRMGFEMLRRHDFAATCLHYSAALRAMT